MNRGWRFCRFRQVLQVVESSCSLVSDTPRFSVVFGRSWTEVGLEFSSRTPLTLISATHACAADRDPSVATVDALLRMRQELLSTCLQACTVAYAGSRPGTTPTVAVAKHKFVFRQFEPCPRDANRRISVGRSTRGEARSGRALRRPAMSRARGQRTRRQDPA